ncbi:MAG TPA: flagellar hook-associated protein FlgK, partial [Peptococcaceae bacterium]|nr:flagellar hook-associated protein FlgK [Peptococcaceae bacterium]
MRSTFFGIELAKRGLQAQQRALDVTGHNVANANTPGFTRQEAVLATETPYPVPGLNMPWGAKQIGTGVEVAEIRRLRDSFIDLQVRHENKALGYWEARENALEKIEVILNEPSDSGLRSVLEAFWQSLEELSKNPESLAVRSVVRQRGLALTETFNHLDCQLRELQDDLDNSVRVKVNEVNSLGRQIADLNQQILKIEVTGARANDLRDRRDVLLDQLARIINIQAYEDDKGLAQVIIGGRPLVQGVHFYGLVAREDPASEAG